MFIADAPAIDFLNSVAVPVDTQVEWLAGGDDFVDWLRQAKLVDDAALSGIRASAGPGELDAVAAQARALREWFRAFVRSHMGAPLTRNVLRALEPLNRLLSRGEVFGQIVLRDAVGDGEPALEFVTEHRWRSPETLLLPIAKTMADLLTSADFRQVKACEGPACTLLFLDTTRGQRRRWCNMAVCGNRAKQAAYRERVAK